MSEGSASKRVHADNEAVSERRLEPQPSPNGVTDHVLLNAVVLDEIFNHLPNEYWKTARLVNKAWHSILQSRWRDQMTYRIGHGKEKPIVKTCTVNFLEHHHPTNSPLDPLQLNCYPIRNVCIKWNRMYNNFILLQPYQTRFWEIFGPGLKRIDLDGILMHKAAHLKTLLFELTPNLEEFRYHRCVSDDMHKLKLNADTQYISPASPQKNLKLLTLNTSLYFNNEFKRRVIDYKPRFPISWIEVFSVFPNIQKLKLDIDPLDTRRPSDLLKLFEAIDVIRKANDNEVINFTELHIFGRAGFAHVDVITNNVMLSLLASLPISILDVDVTAMKNNQIVSLVQAFKSTLRHLRLEFSEDDQVNEPLPRDMFPQGLTKLCLWGPFISSLEFLSYTPNLEELTVDNIPCILPPEVDLASVAPLVNLKKLAYTMNSHSVPREQMDILAKLIPNVKDCDCYVDADAFHAMCRGWPNLEHLNLRGRFNFGNEDFFVENLVQLKCLRSVRINGYIDISDKSVFEAFLKMPSLTRIYLHLNVKITEKGLQALECKLPSDFVLAFRKP